MEAVAAGDEVALELPWLALVLEADPGAVAVEVVDGDAGGLEEQRRAAREARLDQILDDLGLAVDDDRAAAGELAQRNAVPLAVELQLDAVVHESLAPHALADACPVEQVDRALLEHAGADALLHVLAAARLEHDGLDALQLQEPREREAGRAGSDDADLGAHQRRGMRSKSAACPCPTPTQSVARP